METRLVRVLILVLGLLTILAIVPVVMAQALEPTAGSATPTPEVPPDEGPSAAKPTPPASPATLFNQITRCGGYYHGRGVSPVYPNVAPGMPVRWTNQTGATSRLEGLSPVASGGPYTLFLPLILRGPALEPDQGGPPVLTARWHSADIPPGGSYSRVFTQTGLYPYSLVSPGEATPAITGTIHITHPVGTDDISAQDAPAAATLIAPAGVITDTTPTYTWEAVPLATWYKLWVDGPLGTVIQQWYRSENAAMLRAAWLHRGSRWSRVPTSGGCRPGTR
jgi:hypothetical protein